MNNNCLYMEIAERLYQIIPDLNKVRKAATAKSRGFMDLHLDILDKVGDMKTIALSHYYKHPSGDMIADPDMTIRINCKTRLAEALSYQDIFVYEQIYIDDKPSVSAAKQKEINKFLLQWLNNLIEQGFCFTKGGRK